MKPDRHSGVIVGIAGAAGDGLDKTGDTLARTAGRLGLYVYAYNSYQSLIRGAIPGCASVSRKRNRPATATTYMR